VNVPFQRRSVAGYRSGVDKKKKMPKGANTAVQSWGFEEILFPGWNAPVSAQKDTPSMGEKVKIGGTGLA